MVRKRATLERNVPGPLAVSISRISHFTQACAQFMNMAQLETIVWPCGSIAAA